MIEEITHDGAALAMIVSRSYSADGIKFLTPDSYSLQLGYMTRPTGYSIQPHLHLPVERVARYTQEVLFIRSGKVRVDFYSDAKDYITSRILNAGDVILLICGGHGFEILEAADIVEVKQGPFVDHKDKERFNAPEISNLNFDGSRT